MNGNLLVGLRNGSIMHFANALGDETEEKSLLQSHFDGEVWGLTVTPDGLVVTSADDNKIMVIDADAKKVVKTGKVSDKKGSQKKKSTASSMSVFPAN